MLFKLKHGTQTATCEIQYCFYVWAVQTRVLEAIVYANTLDSNCVTA